jgi:hypothetical protein
MKSLSEIRVKFLTAAGVTLDSRAETKISIIRDPQIHVEIIMNQWKAGRSQRPPTWREFLEVVSTELNMKNLSQDILDFMCGKRQCALFCKYTVA